MATRRRLWFMIGFALLVGAWFELPALCRGPQSPEDEVRAAIGAVVDGVGRADLGAALEPISARYQDADGLDRTALQALLFRELQARGPVHAVLGPIAVQVEGEQAQAQFDALLLSGLNPAALDLRANEADAWHFDVELAREEEDWRIVGHERRGVLPQDVLR